MVVRWATASLLETEKRCRRIMGDQHMWILEANLSELAEESAIAKDEQVA